jgi:hypothetical protein
MLSKKDFQWKDKYEWVLVFSHSAIQCLGSRKEFNRNRERRDVAGEFEVKYALTTIGGIEIKERPFDYWLLLFVYNFWVNIFQNL